MNILHSLKNTLRFLTRTATTLGILFALLIAADAAVSVQNVKIQPRYPWNGLADIDFTVVSDDPNEDYYLYFDVKDNDLNRSILPRTLTGAGANGATVKAGTYRTTWNMAADEPKLHSSALSLTVQATTYKPYLYIDITDGANATSYPVVFSATPPSSWNDAEVRYTKLWLRIVQPGTFVMGSPENELGRRDDETQHQVTLTKPYYIGISQITQRQWTLIMGSNPSTFKTDVGPVANVSYNLIRGTSAGAAWPANNGVDATSFMGKLRAKTGLTFDLPTEAQWEYACRAGTTTALNSGQNLTSTTNDPEMAKVGRFLHNKNDGKGGYNQKTKICVYLPNDWGLYDMHGNVYELCLDWYDAYPNGSVTNPTGPASSPSANRVMRGGYYDADAVLCRSACRSTRAVATIGDGVGLRVVVSPEFASSPSSTPVRADVRTSFGGRLVRGVETIGTPDGGTPTSWDTTQVADGWHNRTSGTQTVTLAVRNAANPHVEEGRLAADTVWTSATLRIVRNYIVVPSGVTLTITPGTVIKFTDGTGIVVEAGGKLIASGAIFTHIADDTIGGDTNDDAGKTIPTNDAYTFEGAGQMTLSSDCELRYKTVEVPSGILGTSQVWPGSRVYNIADDIIIPAGVTLNINEGAVLKFAAGKRITVQLGGAIYAKGTARNKIVFTSIKDDAHGGDTNADGKITSPARGDWKSLLIDGHGEFLHCKLLYGGNTDAGTMGDPQQWNTFQGATIRYGEFSSGSIDSCFLADGKFDGVISRMANLVIRSSVIAWHNRAVVAWQTGADVKIINSTLYGFTGDNELPAVTAFSGGTLALENSILSYCSKALTDGGTAHNSIFWNPVGFGPQSDEHVGQNGNRWADPLFYGVETDDFSLRAGSPAIDAGEGGVAPERDYFGQERVNDTHVTDTGTPASNGTVPDIGAYEMTANAFSEVDLLVESVSAPAVAQVNDELTIQYTIANIGSKAAQGVCTSEVFFVNSQTGAIERLAIVSEEIDIAPGEEARIERTIPIPFSVLGAGNFKVLLNADRGIFEGQNTANNATVAAGTTQISLKELAEGEAYITVRGNNNPAWATTTVAALADRVVKVSASAGIAGWAVVGVTPTETAPLALTPARESGYYHVTIPVGTTAITFLNNAAFPFNKTSSGETLSISLLANSSLVFSVFSASTAQLPKTGQASFSVYGYDFTEATEITLKSSKDTLTPESVRYVSKGELVVTVSNENAPVGDYSIVARDGTKTATGGSIGIANALAGAAFDAWLEVPNAIRAGRPYVAYICYENYGDVDIAAPAVWVTSQSQLSKEGSDAMSYRLDYSTGAANIPVGVLRPGETGRIAFVCYANATGDNSLSLSWNDPIGSALKTVVAQPEEPAADVPNEIRGPWGVGEERYVQRGDTLEFKVFFENKPTAGSSAQEIFVVSDRLDSRYFDLSTLELGEVSFGKQIELGLQGKRGGTIEVEQRGKNLRVRVDANFDTATGKITWYLRSVDTTQPDGWPADLYAGILAPNDATGRGEGYVAYRVKVRSNAPHNSRIDSGASIVFDYNAPIVTDPVWFNTVYADSAAPAVPVFTEQPHDTNAVWGSAVEIAAPVIGYGPLSYQWFKDGVAIEGATGASLQIASAHPSNAGTYRVVVSNAFGSVESQPFLLSVQPDDLVLTTQPQDLTVNPGETATFTVAATSNLPLTYQWRKDSVAVSGATSATLTIAAAQLADAGIYTVVVTNDSGFAVSRAATLTVVVPPSIATPLQDVTVNFGETATLTVVATGAAPFSYQWRKAGVDIDGATSATLRITNAQLSDSGFYTVVVSNDFGEIESQPVELTVLPEDLLITAQPQVQTVNPGETATFAVVATGAAPLTYQWRKDGVDIVGDGATSATLVIADAQLADAGVYTVVITNDYGSTESEAATLTVLVSPRITTQPLSQLVPLGEEGTLTVVAVGAAPFSYQWRKDGVNIVGATSATLRIVSMQLTDAAAYTVLVSNAVGAVLSKTATLTASVGGDTTSPPSISKPPASQTVAVGGTVAFFVNATGGRTLSYQWYFNGTALDGKTAAALVISNLVEANAGSYTVVVTNANGTVTSAAAVLTVSENAGDGNGDGGNGDGNGGGNGDGNGGGVAAPIIVSDPVDVGVREGSAVTFRVNAMGKNLTYEWLRNGDVIEGETAATLTIGHVLLDDAGSYQARVTNAGGSDISEPAALSVTGYDIYGLTTKGAKLIAPKFDKKANPLAPKTKQTFVWTIDTGNGAGAQTLTNKGNPVVAASYTAKADGHYVVYYRWVPVGATEPVTVLAEDFGWVQVFPVLKFHKTEGLQITDQLTPPVPAVKNGVVIADGEFVGLTAKLDSAPEVLVIYTWFDGKTVIRESGATFAQTDYLLYAGVTAKSKISVTVRTVATDGKAKPKPLSQVKSKTLAVKAIFPPAVVITTAGVSDANGVVAVQIVAGKTLVLKTKVTGTGKFVYQWQYRVGTGAAWEVLTDSPKGTVANAVAGATGATLSVKATTAGATGQYRVVVTNPAGLTHSATATAAAAVQ
jgi:formylglycine-generating enzyme required for sulfatase activity